MISITIIDPSNKENSSKLSKIENNPQQSSSIIDENSIKKMDILKTISYSPINVIAASNDTQAMRTQINMTDLDKKPSLRARENENKIITEAKENKELLTKIDMTIERKTKRQLTTTAINDVINKIKQKLL